MSPQKASGLVALLLLLLIPAAAQRPTIKMAPAPYTPPGYGEQMYKAYCASCHGNNGTGNGPAAPALNVAPPDLTKLTWREGGTFPFDHVYEVIKGEANFHAHGSKEMPVWGPVFRTMAQRHEAEVQLRLTNLTKCVQSMQQQ